MEDRASHNINQENDIENKINFNRFDIAFLYIIIIDKIISLKNRILRRKEKVLIFQRYIHGNKFPYLENGLFKVKIESIMIIIKMAYKKINYKIKDNQVKKRKNNIKNKNTIIRYYIIIHLINFF